MRKFSQVGVEKFEKILQNKDFSFLQKFILETFIKYGGEEFQEFSDKNFLNDDQFHYSAIKLRNDNPKNFGLVYDVVQNSAAIFNFFTSKTLLEFYKNKLGYNINRLVIYPCVLRMDVPRDERNILTWHQDSLVEEINHSYADATTLWVPLLDATKENGCCEFCLSSHHERYPRNINKRNANDKQSSISMDIPNDIPDKFLKEKITAKRKDIVTFSLNTLHRSGINHSNMARFTVIARIYDIHSSSYVPGKTIYKKS